MKKNKFLPAFLLFALMLSVCSCQSPVSPPEETTTFLEHEGTWYSPDRLREGLVPWDIKRIEYAFDTYEDLILALVEADPQTGVNLIHSEKEEYEQYFGEGYTRFVNDLTQKQAIPVPLKNGQPIAPHRDGDDRPSRSISLWPINGHFVGDLSELSYQLGYDDPYVYDLWVRLFFPAYSELEAAVQAEDYWDIAEAFNYPRVPGQYKSFFLEKREITLADCTVSARIVKSNDNTHITIDFMYEGIIVTLYGRETFFTDEFFKSFSIGEYSIAPSVDQTSA